MKGNHQAFTTAEFRSRLERVQKAMARQGIDLLLIHTPENIYYLTGYQTSGYFSYQVLLVSGDGDPMLLVRFLERGNVDEYAWLPAAQTWREGEDVVERTIDLIRAVGGDRRTIGLEKQSWFLTAEVAEVLAGKLPSARIVNGSGLVESVRLIKSEAEVRYIRQAAAIAELEQRAALEALKPGATEADVAAAVHVAGIRAGCEYTGLPHHIMSGYRYDVCHANWGPKVIRKGELVLLELYGCVERYHATQMRTVAVGAPTEEAVQVADLLITAQDEALSVLKPGASSRDVDAVVRRAIRKIRPDYYNRSGYSIGIGFPPRSGEWHVCDFNEHRDWEVKAGMTFHMLVLAQNVGISETVLVTDSGCTVLTTANPRELLQA